MAKQIKTNAARLLDRAAVEYELVRHEVDENDLSAERVAREMEVEVAMLYKTLVLEGDSSGVIVCLIPGDREVDLKRAAVVSGNKKVALLHLKELLSTTGYIRGGCSPIGMKRNFPLYVDKSALDRDKIFVNGGARGVQLKLNPKDLIKLLKAEVAELF